MNDSNFDEIEQNISKLQENIDNIKKSLHSYKESTIQVLYKEEQPDLDERFFIVIFILAVFIVGSFTTIALGLKNEINLFWLCSAAGTLGSTIAALLSCLQRRSNGLEFKNGKKYPKDNPADKFSLRMSTFYILRPLLGLFAGLVVYFGIQYILKVELIQDEQNRYIFWSLMGGLFAKSLIAKLKDLFDALIGK